MILQWQPYREPLRVTLLRTGSIALVLGAALAFWRGGWRNWPIATLLVLWFSFGGHWVELFFLNWLRPRLPDTRAVQVGARMCVWFVGGIVLAMGMKWSAELFGYRPVAWPAWWSGGLAFIGVELIVHLVMHLTARPNFYNGRG